MSPASYQTAPPRVDCCPFVTVTCCPTATVRSGKRDSNPRPQPWQGCALPTELFPRAANLTGQWEGIYHPMRTLRAPVSSGGEGDRTPDLVNAIHALSQLSYAPLPLRAPPAPARRPEGQWRFGGNTASYRRVQAVSSDFGRFREHFRDLCVSKRPIKATQCRVPVRK